MVSGLMVSIAAISMTIAKRCHVLFTTWFQYVSMVGERTKELPSCCHTSSSEASSSTKSAKRGMSWNVCTDVAVQLQKRNQSETQYFLVIASPTKSFEVLGWPCSVRCAKQTWLALHWLCWCCVSSPAQVLVPMIVARHFRCFSSTLERSCCLSGPAYLSKGSR